MEDKKTDISTHSVPRPESLLESQTEDIDPLQIMNELNNVRGEIIRRHYGLNVVGKSSDTITVIKFWEILKMGVNIFMTKPNTV